MEDFLVYDDTVQEKTSQLLNLRVYELRLNT